ncbi:hypothetical protein BV20DRAFT_992578 [Pilatotrama ljubarskyi]|nr:hypothetical protein BV20DRAFT_992578 [Pilatotrama ljubarskyi]
MAADPSLPSTSYAQQRTTPASPESRRKSHYGPRGRQFTDKHGSKVHAYEPAKAPWPLSYDDSTLQLEMMDTALVSGYQGVVSLVDHKGKEPARCLDIGTGLGLWVTQSAKYWKNSTFVGFDLVDVQIPLSILDPDDARRIEWVHGNMCVAVFPIAIRGAAQVLTDSSLTGPLPFEDEEFDHVRFTEVALGIPENKWTAVFEEIRRVMKPGATIEVIEEDAIFPVLPRWFTEPLHARTRWPSISMQDGSKEFLNPSLTPDDDIAHEYELLEILFNKVFDRRFINTKPSSTLPAYFSTHFGQVISPPVLTVPMPPLPPVQPRPQPRTSRSSHHSDSSQSVLFGDPAYILPGTDAKEEMSLAALHGGAGSSARSVGSASSSVAPRSTTVTASGVIVRQHSYTDNKSTKSSSSPASTMCSGSRSPGPSRGSKPGTGRLSTDVHTQSHAHAHAGSSSQSARPRTSSDASMASMASKRAAAISDLAAVSTTMGERAQIEMFPIDGLLMFDLHSLCLHLRRALGVVLSLREAMWDELQALWKVPREARDVDLAKYGFSLGEDTLETVRGKYIALLDQYKSDMHVRMSIWHSLVHFGWEYPQRDPMSKAEEMEELRLREDILSARRKAGAENEREPPCRAVRVLVGAKV